MNEGLYVGLQAVRYNEECFEREKDTIRFVVWEDKAGDLDEMRRISYTEKN